ncbi:MAG TPA: cell wall-binding repeat-containing protein [Euzebya sp.]|nr:cell wall-binding repeat-containing protein [Euzebya sp.]
MLLFGAALPAAAQETSIVRLAGQTRVNTAIAISTDAYAPGTAERVILAREDQYADALAGGPLAAAQRGPLLLTPTSQLASVVQDELRRVLPAGGVVYLLGGPAALAPAVAEQVTELGYEVIRLGGDTRYETAVEIAGEAAPTPGFITVATGNDFPDALIAGSLATPFAGGLVLLTDGDRLPDVVADYLADNADVDVVTVGPAAATAYPGAFNVGGQTASQRSVVAAETFYPALEPAGVALASVAAFPDGLAGAAHAFASGPIPLLLTPADELPQSHIDYVSGLEAAGLSYVYGGNAAIHESVLDQLRTALQG